MLDEPDGSKMVGVYVLSADLLEWAKKPRTRSGELPRVIDVLWLKEEKKV